jgi:hypothetical protein
MVTCLRAKKKMNKESFIKMAQSFEPADEDNFNELIRYGLELSGKNYKELAGEFECIPSTVLRWAEDRAEPMPGVKRFVVKTLLKWVCNEET